MIQDSVFKAYAPRFRAVVDLPPGYEVYDFTSGYDPVRARTSLFGVGRYDERRRGMYVSELFSSDSSEEMRDVHVGVDIAAPVGTPVHAFFDGEVFLFGYNGAAGDYGYTLITRHIIDGIDLYALYGHLSAASVEGKTVGASFRAGEVLAWIGDTHENGGWNPHLHFQLSYERPCKCDMPGVVSMRDREAALRRYPDPRLVLGPLY